MTDETINAPAPSLFAYGTLMFAEVFQAVTRLDCSCCPATLADYTRKQVLGHEFPAIHAQTGAEVSGYLFGPLDYAAWRNLDDFEGDFYTRITVSVRTGNSTRAAADTYVTRAQYRGLLATNDWSPSYFRDHHLPRYLAAYNHP